LPAVQVPPVGEVLDELLVDAAAVDAPLDALPAADELDDGADELDAAEGDVVVQVGLGDPLDEAGAADVVGAELVDNEALRDEDDDDEDDDEDEDDDDEDRVDGALLGGVVEDGTELLDVRLDEEDPARSAALLVVDFCAEAEPEELFARAEEDVEVLAAAGSAGITAGVPDA
jgi:hypothetical protein